MMTAACSDSPSVFHASSPNLQYYSETTFGWKWITYNSITTFTKNVN